MLPLEGINNTKERDVPQEGCERGQYWNENPGENQHLKATRKTPLQLPFLDDPHFQRPDHTRLSFLLSFAARKSDQTGKVTAFPP